MRRAQILGVGSYVPAQIVTNRDLEKMMDTSHEWIIQRTGIEERRWVTPFEECNSDLALKASERALAAAGIDKFDLDLIIFATLSPDHDFPGTGVFLQAKLGLEGIPTLDIRQQCTGFIYGMSIADQFIRTGMYEKILVVGSEVHSTGLDKSTAGRDVTVLFGDGAGAIVLGAIEISDANRVPGILSTHLHTDGRFAKELWMPAAGCANQSSERVDRRMLDEGLQYPKMNGKKVFLHAVKKMSETLLECAQANAIDLSEIDLFFFHQANLRINEAVAEQLKLPPEKLINTIQKYGNTTAATIPLGMDEALKSGALKRGQLIAMAAFGSGFTWASSLVRY